MTVVEIDIANLVARVPQILDVPLAPRFAGVRFDRRINAVPDRDAWLIVTPAASVEEQSTVAEIVVVEGFLTELDARVPPLE